jgi:hypothetical protein
MKLPTGDYLVQVIDRNGEVMPGWSRVFAVYFDAYNAAPAMLTAAGGQSWRIIKCIINSEDLVKGRW